jgi:hypothetical protein
MKLSRSDAKSLSNTLSLIKDFGDEFQRYRNAKLRGIPNVVIYNVCKLLKKEGYQIIATREMSRYNIILTFCVQQNWRGYLDKVFERISFYSLKEFNKGQKYDGTAADVQRFYQELLMNLNNITNMNDLLSKIAGIEQNEASYIAIINTCELRAVMTFTKKPLNKVNNVFVLSNGKFRWSRSGKSKNPETKNDSLVDQLIQNIQIEPFKQNITFPVLKLQQLMIVPR